MNLSFEQFQPTIAGLPSMGTARTMAKWRKKPEAVHAPEGYYRQPEGQQLALPGMKMTPKQHLEALGNAHGLVASMSKYDDTHVIELHEPDRDPKLPTPPTAVLEWAARDSDPQWNAQPGEIGMVHTVGVRERQGIAGDILSTAEKIAREGGKVSVPKHSTTRSVEGKAWSRARMRERGEQVW